MAETVLVDNHGPVRILTLNRPHRLNAIDLQLRYELADELELATDSPLVRVIVLTGAGNTFCPGGDISTMARQSPDKTIPCAQAAQRVIRAIWNGDKPVLAAVEGAAFGAGVSLAMACDRVVAADDAVLSTAFTGVGLAGDMGIFSSLPARVGPAVARQLMLLPRRLSGLDVRELGMVDETVPPGTALDRAIGDAERISQAPPLALPEMKALWTRWATSPTEMLKLEVDAQARLFDTADFAEGVAAFHDKRTPEFSGT